MTDGCVELPALFSEAASGRQVWRCAPSTRMRSRSCVTGWRHSRQRTRGSATRTASSPGEASDPGPFSAGGLETGWRSPYPLLLLRHIVNMSNTAPWRMRVEGHDRSRQRL